MGISRTDDPQQNPCAHGLGALATFRVTDRLYIPSGEDERFGVG